MKRTILILMAICAAALAPVSRAAGSVAASILPIDICEISSIEVEGTNVVVTAEVAAQYAKITLESRPRAASGVWEPRAIQRLETGSTPVRQVVFKLPPSANMELLRVRGDLKDSLPTEFYKGTNSFGVPGSSGGSFAGGPVLMPTASQEVTGDASKSATRTVVESDIWKLDGDTLYFFNQYRGLQVIDVSQPDRPVVRGTYPVAASGEDMYLLDPTHVVLLARDQCNWSGTAQSRILLLEIKNGQPALIADVPVAGQVQESRLVGTALYVVSEQYRVTTLPPAKEGGEPQQVWEWGSQVSSFDLANFEKPEGRSSQWLPGYGNAIQATDRFLFVAAPRKGEYWWNGPSEVQVFDIASPDGTMTRLSSIQAKGRVKDKFKMDLNGDTLTLVTESSTETLRTQVETYSLKDPANPASLGYLKIIDGEQLHATRFAGQLLYAVTFKRVDPLWIIDLSDPAQPKKLSELEIPGWSTFIYPWNDRLITIGIDNTEGWRTAVQLFDVHDPAKPALIKKVVLGEQYSSSEANSDEKAFGVFPDQNLILVPYTTWDGGTSFQGVHLIDLKADGLTARGSIEHSVEARRATPHRDRILSLSGAELLTVDATDRDHPKVTSSTELSWSVDRLFLAGSHLIEIGTPWNDHATLRVVKANATTEVLKVLSLDNLPLLGATLKDNRLYVAQGKSTEYVWPTEYNPTNYAPLKTNAAVMRVTIFDTANLPELTKVGSTERVIEGDYRSLAQLDPIWPKANLLVWGSSGYGYWGPFFKGGVADMAGRGIGGAIWWGGGSDRTLMAYDVSQAASPGFLSEVVLRGTNGWWDFSKAFTTDGLVLVSRQTSEFEPAVKPLPVVTQQWDGKQYITVTNEPSPGTWVQRYYLDVINYADPAEPSVRKPVNIPGSLIGVAKSGSVLFTQASRYLDTVNWGDWSEWLEASSYDGVEARLIDSMRLPTDWPHPVLATESTVLLGRPGVKSDPAVIEAWSLGELGKFVKAGSTAVKSAPNALRNIGALLIGQNSTGVDLYDLTNPAGLRLLGSGDAGCYGYDVNFADGALERGLWIPLGAYGAVAVEVPTAAAN